MTLRKEDSPPGARHNHRRDQAASERGPKRGRIMRVLVGVGKLGGLIGVCAVAVWGGSALWQYGGPWVADAFRIQEVFVTGNHHVTRADVLAHVRLGKDATLYSFDAKALIERLKTLPWIKEVRLTRVPFHVLEVEIVERQPAGVIQGVHANVLVDEEGVILKWIGQSTDDTLPLVKGIDIKNLAQAGGRERRMAKEAFELAALIERVDGGHVQVDASHATNLVVSVNETRVSFGRAPFQDKWTLYQQLKPVLVAEHGASLAQRQLDIDLRFMDRVIVRERG